MAYMYALRALIYFLLFILGRRTVSGRENIPASGPYIVVINHMSVADSPLLLITLPPTRLRFFAGEKWKSHWFLGPILAWTGAIYINRGEVDRHALRQALAAIRRGSIFGLAPEGSRSKQGALRPGLAGAAYLAARTGVPILPVGMVNTDTLAANIKRLRRTHMEVHIGKPFTLPDLGHRPKATELAALTRLIMIHVAALIPSRYHGYYAGSDALAALQHGADAWALCLREEGLDRLSASHRPAA